jgi:hypothetical protein
MRILVVLFVVGVCFVCTSCRTPVSSDSPDHTQIVEALFRYLAQPAPVNDPDSHGVNLAHKVYFLQVESHDPSQSFLSRLTNFAVPVKGLSAGIMTNGCWVDKATGEQGVAFFISDVKMVGRSNSEADAAISAGSMRASGFQYYLAKEVGKWSVVKRKFRWVS